LWLLEQGLPLSDTWIDRLLLTKLPNPQFWSIELGVSRNMYFLRLLHESISLSCTVCTGFLISSGTEYLCLSFKSDSECMRRLWWLLHIASVEVLHSSSWLA
jgi:hypothetical protein